ncbi:hypothetical protein [Bacillus alkalicellulosilyticus]|uniref:hypothetical protein n=1 Tax=Alkalihalobacterium alkalicellulosilyticum TaxID=1912214 RepID=UPI001481D7DC|nr:hypothetical protein [Bacillus alkalicellulosilyticus]
MDVFAILGFSLATGAMASAIYAVTKVEQLEKKVTELEKRLDDKEENTTTKA